MQVLESSPPPCTHLYLHHVCVVQVFESEGFAPLQDSYLASWLHTGQQVTFQQQAAEGEEEKEGASLVIQGITPTGESSRSSPQQVSHSGHHTDII